MFDIGHEPLADRAKTAVIEKSLDALDSRRAVMNLDDGLADDVPVPRLDSEQNIFFRAFSIDFQQIDAADVVFIDYIRHPSQRTVDFSSREVVATDRLAERIPPRLGSVLEQHSQDATAFT